MQITILGSGTSHGVPAIDCLLNQYATCPKGVCQAAASDHRHQRTRCSLYLETPQQALLIDVSADFRQQMLRRQITRLDAVLLTHSHADHINGMPDIRSYTKDKLLPVYGTRETIRELKRSYHYIFHPPANPGGGIPLLTPRIFKGPFSAGGQPVIPIPVKHGSLRGCCGFRIGSLAYIPDLKALAPGSAALLQGLEILIIDALRTDEPHSTHMILPESLELARSLRPRRCYFTHLSHGINYRTDSQQLDANMQFAHDGLQLRLED